MFEINAASHLVAMWVEFAITGHLGQVSSPCILESLRRFGVLIVRFENSIIWVLLEKSSCLFVLTAE